MSRRSTPQTKIDDAAFPVRIFVQIPEGGFSVKFDRMFEWLRERVGRENFAQSGGPRIATIDGIVDATTFYFRDIRTAADFVEAFDLVLADGTTSSTYTSPYLPFGRR